MINNLRYAIRQLLKSPGFTSTAVITLALGIGASTAIFSVLHAVLLRALPYREADRLVAVWQFNLERQARDKVTCADYADWKARNHVFEDMAYSMDEPYTLTDTGTPVSVAGFQFSTNLFSLLGARPLLGRTFLPEDGEPGKDHVLVLSHRLWEKQFASDRNVVGRSVRLNGEPFTIIGVMPPEFAHPGTFVDLWTPLALASNWFDDRKLHVLHVVARLRSGVDLAHVQREMETLAADVARQHPETNKNWSSRLAPIRDLYTGNLREALWVLQAAVFLMLIIACANVANMLLAQASTREREVAIRLALGARRRHLFSQFLTQGLILASFGAAGGLLLAFWGVQVLPQMFSTQLSRTPLPTHPSEWIDWPVLLFALATAVIAGVVFGLMPAFRAPRLPQEVLKAGARGSTDHALSARLRSLLIVSQVALSLMLLVGSGLLIRSFLRLQEQSLGFQTDRVAASFLLLAPNRYPGGSATTIFLEQLLARLKDVPGLESAAAISTLPLSGNDAGRPFTIPGQPEERGQPNIARFRLVTPDYFQTMQIPLKRGRSFDERDRTGSAEVAIISDGLARHFWPNEDPIGKTMMVPDMQTPAMRQIVGVVGDVRHYGLAEEAPIEIYRPFYQAYWPFFTVVARASLAPAQLANTLTQAIASVDKDQPIQSVRMMEELASNSVALRRASMVLLAIFAAVALLLAALGIYSVMSYMVAQRTQEIGIRMALGARKQDVLRLVTREAVLLAATGIVLGLLGSFALTRLTTLLYGVQPTDPGAVAFVLLIAAANVANLQLARAASREREMAVRLALGANCWRIVRQLLTESLMLASVGGVFGLLLGRWGMDLFRTFGPANLPRLQEINLDVRVLGFTMLAALLSGLIFGMAPALQSSRADLNEALKKQGARAGTEGHGRKRLRGLLVVAEVALTLVLLVGAGLLLRSFWRLQEVTPGFEPDHLLTAQISLPAARYAEDQKIVAFYQDLINRLESLPGVQAAAISMSLPPNQLQISNDFEVEGRPPAPGQRRPVAEELTISSDYFTALGVPLLRGRVFTDADKAGAPPALIINEAMARRSFPNEDPVGKRLQTGDPNPNAPWQTIVGVVGNVKYTGLKAAETITMYAPYTTPDWVSSSRSMYLVVRTTHEPLSLSSALRQQVRALDQDLPVTKLKTMEHVIYESIAGQRFGTSLLGLFAVVALLLAVVGIYGVISYAVTERTHEIGIRMALGAHISDVLKLVIGQGMKLALGGVAIGLVAAFALTRLMKTLLFGVSTTDPLTFAGIVVLLIGVALLACYIAAPRASKVDPLVALRYE